MNEKIVDKIVEQLTELAEFSKKRRNMVIDSKNNDITKKSLFSRYDGMMIAYAKAIEIVKQEAEKFGTDTNVGSNGWIPCSERLPEESLNSVIGWDEYRERCCCVQYIGGRWILGNDIDSVKIIAWQPLPEPFQPKGE